MKKSHQIVLTLFVPALTALGCSNQPSTVTRTQSDCSTPAKPGEPPKTPCDPNAHTNNQRVRHSTSYIPIPWGGWGRSSVAPSSSSHVSSSSGTSSHVNSGTHSGFAPSTASRSSSVSHGGFGRTGSSFSSGS
ncbi:MAG: hypothetical protein ACK5OB_13210 [Pirellula sp.]